MGMHGGEHRVPVFPVPIDGPPVARVLVCVTQQPPDGILAISLLLALDQLQRYGGRRGARGCRNVVSRSGLRKDCIRNQPIMILLRALVCGCECDERRKWGDGGEGT